MKTKLVYVYVGGDGDYYYEMLMMSIYSFRIYHPHDEIQVVMDEDTFEWLQRKRATLLSDVTPIVVHISEEYNIMQRSRYLKTTLRQIIKGDFLYIDGDTIICSKLDDLDSMDPDISMVLNLHRKDEFLSQKNVNLCKAAGMDTSGMRPYYNGGAAFVKDTPVSYDFYEHWHLLWLKSLANGVPQDQPALCQTDFDLGFPVKEMWGGWNCQVGYGGIFGLICRAKIIHYFSANSWGMMKTVLMKRVHKSGRVDGLVAVLLHFPRLFFAIRYLNTKMKEVYYIVREKLRKR